MIDAARRPGPAGAFRVTYLPPLMTRGDSSAGFVPAVIVPEIAAATGPLTADGSGRIEIVMANGRRVIVNRDVDVEALLRIVQALERLA
ncbi:hypothetical protein [Xanthobacter aminoxidans]|uniref:hypothetical protein n=1 Tax=Xanthobacter aminoxidans TaxID=186280 RepID=UPI002022F7D1|nr:hypothetical protein [Xanthobacter aminoxidans]MCL8385426.1 hypothetical protein [Xanthobacter aminoxidans]